MSQSPFPPFDAELDLVLERMIDVPAELIWQAWTRPEHLREWFAPRPWSIADCEIDLRPGGIFRTVMRSPEGQEFPSVGCYLDIVENSRLVFTDALLPGYRPTGNPFFTGILTLGAATEGGTKYSVRLLHTDRDGRKKHEEMGFHQGWNQCLDQLVALVGQQGRGA